MMKSGRYFLFTHPPSMRRFVDFYKNKIDMSPHCLFTKLYDSPPKGLEFRLFVDRSDNLCPFIFNDFFTLTFCKINNKEPLIIFKNEAMNGEKIEYVALKENIAKNDIIIFCTYNHDWTEILVDLVFKVGKIIPFKIDENKQITSNELKEFLKDNEEIKRSWIRDFHFSSKAFNSHDFNTEETYVSLISDKEGSFQPQEKHRLINIFPILRNMFKTEEFSENISITYNGNSLLDSNKIIGCAINSMLSRPGKKGKMVVEIPENIGRDIIHKCNQEKIFPIKLLNSYKRDTINEILRKLSSKKES